MRNAIRRDHLNEKKDFKKFQMADPRWRLIQYQRRHYDVIIVANDNQPIVRHNNLIEHLAAKGLWLYIQS